ncbi:Spc97/Spc98 [Penicillium robsamsonii]|uniref:Spc97/Spc98 n=1 Tax=Penicillium robsamsonii TaxID=1792511 RepID=UPI0025472F5D|nr:Spc97/Spc98 [Penicillium robsamsonii]KAJ5836724.1 Spc97/Spc98 [Penicillium robsamsonii]
MALAADLSTLADALITSVTKISPDQKGSARFQSLKRRVQGGLRTGSHTRTDQFAVAKQLEGLQEKFQILNRDELAEALHIRLVELERNQNSWLPEILSLLLQLSDRPALLSTVKRSEEGAKAPEPKETLSWSDLNADGTAFSDEEIWEQVDFAGDSSDDDFSSVASDVSLPKHRPQPVTTVDEGYTIPEDVFVPTEDENLVVSLEKAQFWRAENHPSLPQGGGSATSRLVTESQLARETIFMLQGLPTSIYVYLDDDFGADRRYMLAHSSRESLASLLRCFSEIGAKLNNVRCFTKLPQTIPYMQTFCRGIEDRLLEFDRVLSQVQCTYLSAGSTVSLIQLLVDVRQHSHELVLLAEMITKLGKNSTDQPMRCLDLLYNLICKLEALGDETSSQRLAELFFMCFKTYSSSIRLWMETGQVDASDSTFFVRTNRENGDLRTLWHDWFVLDTGHRNQRIPRFLEAGVQKVFTAGKSMVFLRHLNAPPDIEAMRFEDLYSQDSSVLLPFPGLVESAFEKLVDVDHSLSASLLRTELDQQCGLRTSLDALQHVYLAKNMSAVSVVDAKIFELIDRGRSWDDRFLLTEISRTAFNSVSVIDTSRLLVRPASTPSRVSQNNHRTVGILEAISIDYGLPWPIANIITDEAIHTYQRISTFLMQIRRAKYAIVRQRIRDARITTPDDNDTLVHALHHNMLWVLDFIYGHLTYLVISTATKSLHKDLSGAQDVDAMIAAHQSYMSSLEAQCLLSKELSHIHDAIINFLDLCVHFADLQAAHLLGDEDQHLENLKTPDTKRDPEDEFDTDDDEDYDDMNHEHTLTVSFRDSTYTQQMKTVNNHFSHLTTVVTDGLKTLAQADGLQSWDILADRLEWRRNWRRL